MVLFILMLDFRNLLTSLGDHDDDCTSRPSQLLIVAIKVQRQ